MIILVIAPCLADGLGLCEALADAVSGRGRAIGWPAAGSRPRWRAFRADASQTMRDMPGVGRAITAAARFAWTEAAPAGSARLTPPPASRKPTAIPAGADQPAALPDDDGFCGR
ncbi:hypothetical protein [Mycobacterium pseudokansasii]|uniref:Uncharacterized protein n=1 Tax=Mycobacterium pseudokansasii TaxID=2341080 RepID=A0A498QXT0_9MYCO|nr:hypothetical protein [Mycobacterium pseudokansasii]VBA51395.1 hypothetical protein LAUMK142_03080 [Mycobacterium pseudokansasii]